MKYLVIAVSLLAVLLWGCARKDAAPTEATFPETTAGETVPLQTQVLETVPTLAREEPADEDFVRVADYIPTITQDLRYATENNFTGQRIYDFTQVYLRWGTVKKLMDVSRELEAQGLYLKIWDGFRPVSAQFRLWEVYPDPTYVSNPETGYSSHSRGNTVDLTLVDSTGQELEMPTEFDDFSALADRDYSDCPETAAANARALETLMEQHGFTGYFGEWWHFSDTQTYPVEMEFTPPVSEE